MPEAMLSPQCPVPRRPGVQVAPGQLVHVLELLDQTQRVIERLGRDWAAGRKVVQLPAEGYPLKWIERDAIVQALELAHWVQRDAAVLLGITTRVMNYKVQVFNLQPPSGRHWRGRHR